MKFASQSTFDVRFEWGIQAIANVCDHSGVAIIVDVLSFSTCVDIACSRGASIIPCSYADDRAPALAAERGAIVARRRGEEGYSLSPESLLNISRGTRLVLPSPNGSALSLQAKSQVVIAACFRNMRAVTASLVQQTNPITVVAAGERWNDGSLRPAIEDMLCAGAIIDNLGGSRSPEAKVAAAAYNGARDDLSEIIGECASAVELTERGFVSDVALALEVNASRCVAQLIGGAYVANSG